VDDHGLDSTPTGSQTGEDLTFSGTVEAVTASSITIDGKLIALGAGSRLDSGVVVGSMVKVEVIRLADGTLLAKEVESETEHLNGDDRGSGTELGDDHGGSSVGSDDHGGSSVGSDDHGGSTVGSDDHGGSTVGSDDHGGSSSGSDDHGGSSGGSDDHGDSGKGKSTP
jgi:hypothetical protein